jgi:hypothetical protein
MEKLAITPTHLFLNHHAPATHGRTDQLDSRAGQWAADSRMAALLNPAGRSPPTLRLQTHVPELSRHRVEMQVVGNRGCTQHRQPFHRAAAVSPVRRWSACAPAGQVPQVPRGRNQQRHGPPGRSSSRTLDRPLLPSQPRAGRWRGAKLRTGAAWLFRARERTTRVGLPAEVAHGEGVDVLSRSRGTASPSPAALCPAVAAAAAAVRRTPPARRAISHRLRRGASAPRRRVGCTRACLRL